MGLECGTGFINWTVRLEYGTGINSILAPEPIIAGADNKVRQGVLKLSVEFTLTR